MVSAPVTEEIKDVVRGLILLFPAMCIADDWNERFPNKEDIPEIQELWGDEFRKKIF